MNPSPLGVMLVLGVTFSAATVRADPIAVRFTEGVTRGFPVVRSLKGEKLAQGDLSQIPHGDRIESRMIFRFIDGSYYEESLVYSQRDVFTLLSYRVIQRGPSFPETLDAFVDRETRRYRVRYKADPDSAEEVFDGRIELPADTYNGMVLTLLKNMPEGASNTVHVIAFTPKPRLIKLLLVPVAEDAVLVGDSPMQATRFMLRPQLGLFASLLVTDLPDVKCWILGGDAPAFLRFEGPLYFMGPVWRIEPN
jgi:hypothetical protein